MKWMMFKGGEVVNVFDDRKMAVKHLKELLKQTLKDFENQDKTDEFSYSIIISKIEIIPLKERESYLGLIG